MTRTGALLTALAVFLAVSCDRVDPRERATASVNSRSYSGWAALSGSIQAFQKVKGDWPASIAELKANGYLPNRFKYVSEHGLVWHEVTDLTFSLTLVKSTKSEAVYRVTVVGVDLGEEPLGRDVY